MNVQPDWIKGGDPHRTEWSGGKDLIAELDIRWHKSGEWNEDGRIITVESATNEKGEHVAIRIQGEIKGTARGVPGELGWCKKKGVELMIPFISPNAWSAPWLLWFYGEITSEELFDKLGLANRSPTSGRVFLKYAGDLPYRRLRMQIGAAIRRSLPAIAIGFLLGWTVNASLQQTYRQPSAPNQQSTPFKSHQSGDVEPEGTQRSENGNSPTP